MEATSESSDQAVNLPVIDLRLVSQSELYTISLSHATACNRRIDEGCVIPKIDRSVFKESTGSRKQTFSRLRLFPRNNNNPYSPVPVSAAVAPVVVVPSASRITADGENSQILDLLQELFGVEPLRGKQNDCAVPLQVDFKQPALEFMPQAVQNAPIDGSQRKRKRGRPRRGETTPGTEALLAICDGNGKAMETDDEKKVETVNHKKKKVETGNEKRVETANEKQGLVLDDAGDPFVEELIVRTQGMNTGPELVEFLEGLNGVWASDRKKRRIVDANCLRDVLPTGWKLILTLQRRGARASVLCRRYISPDGGQFETYKDASSYLVSLLGVQDASHFKSFYADGSKQFSSNINMSSENQNTGHVPTGGIMIDANASSHHEKQATISSPIGTEKRNTSDGNLNGDLAAMDCELGDVTNGTFGVSNHPTDNKLPLKADKNDANSVQECFLSEDRVYNSVGPIPTGGMKIDANTSSHQEKRATMSSSIDNEQVRVGDNGLGLSVTLMENHIQKIASESSMLVPNSQDISTNGKLQFCPEGSLVPSQNELNHTSIESMDREETSVLKDSAEAKKNYNDLPGASTDETTWDNNEYMNNISFDPWQQDDAPVSDVIDFIPNLYVTNGFSDNHAPPLDEVATSCLQKMNSPKDQIYTVDNLLHRSESNLFTVTGNQHPSALHDNMNNISVEAFGAVKHVDASPRVLQGESQSVSPGGSILNQFDKKNDDGVNNGNTSCLSGRKFW